MNQKLNILLIGIGYCLLLSPTTLLGGNDFEKSPNVETSANIFINAPVSKVWAVFAEDFEGIGKWSSGVAHSEGFGEPFGGSSCTVRACEITAVGFSNAREEIIDFNEEEHEIRYALYDAIPPFVKDFYNIWKFEDKDGGTYVTANSEFRATGPFGLMMKGIMKGATRKALESMCTELKYYVENDAPHPDKVKSIKKIAKKHNKKRKKVVSFEVEQEIDAPIEKVWEVIATDFANIANSNPNCPKSEWFQNSTKAEVGAKRIMYMTDNEKKYFIDKITELNEVSNKITIEVIQDKGFPINTNHTWVNMEVLTMQGNKALLKIQMNYLTKPGFLRGLAKGNLKKQFQKYAYGIDYHVETGENVTKEKWKTVKGIYL